MTASVIYSVNTAEECVKERERKREREPRSEIIKEAIISEEMKEGKKK